MAEFVCLPNPGSLLGLLKRIDAEENLERDALNLFFLFFQDAYDSWPEFRDRIQWLKEHDEQQRKAGGGWVDEDTRAVMERGYENPRWLANHLWERTEAVIARNRTRYEPDAAVNDTHQRVTLYLEAARFWRLRRVQGLSEDARDALARAQSSLQGLGEIKFWYPTKYLEPIDPDNPHFRLAEITEPVRDPIVAPACVVHDGLEEAARVDGRYEEALIHATQALEFAFKFNVDVYPRPLTTTAEGAPWWRQIRVGGVSQWVRCAEALRAGNAPLHRPEAFMNACDYLATSQGVFNDVIPESEDFTGVDDSSGRVWDWAEYWYRARAWAEMQLTPQRLHEFLQTERASAAEGRLQTYFFDAQAWGRLSARARRSLIAADQIWNEAALTRTEALLNELRVATEEIIRDYFWQPLNGWLHDYAHGQSVLPIMNIVKSFKDSGQPSLNELKALLEDPGIRSFLADMRVKSPDADWLTRDLPRQLKDLQAVRNRAEHQARDWTHAELRVFVAPFLGIGEPGVLPRLLSMLGNQRK